MSSQQNNLNITRFNNFISQATDLLSCDDTCQRNKQEATLKESVLNAEINLATAPTQVETSNKEYITYSQGEAAYNNYIINKLTVEAEKNAQSFSTDFNRAAESTKTFINTYYGITQNVDHLQEYYNALLKENKVMTLQLKNKFSDVVTNDRRTFYEDQKIESLYFYYEIMIFIYFIACVSFAISSVLRPSIIGRKTQFIMLIFFLIYPFVCTRFFLFLGTIYDNVVSLLPKNVYKNPQANYSPNQTVIAVETN